MHCVLIVWVQVASLTSVKGYLTLQVSVTNRRLIPKVARQWWIQDFQDRRANPIMARQRIIWQFVPKIAQK